MDKTIEVEKKTTKDKKGWERFETLPSTVSYHPDFRYDPESPLLLGEHESHAANRALNDFYHMGSKRTVIKLGEAYVRESEDGEDVPTDSIGTLQLWSSKYQWADRVVLQTRIDVEQNHQKWLERRELVREEDWQVSNKLRDIADAILQREIDRIEAELEGEGSIVKFDAFAVSKLIDLSAKLRRLATELPASISKLEAGMELSGTINSKTEKYLDMDEDKLNETLRRLSQVGIVITEDHPYLARGEGEEGDEGEDPE